MRNRIFVIAISALLLAGACSSNKQREYVPVVDPELMNLSKEEIFERGEKLFEQGKYARARRYYSNVYETYPNDPLGRRSLLRVADTYFKQGDPVNLVEAQYKYRDFINRYPGSEFADYAMLQIAMVSHKQMEKPDRDQTRTREAVEKFREMLLAFPNSKYRPEAEKRLQEALDRLAKHEHIIAGFYQKRGNHDAAVRRLNWLLDQYPNYGDKDEVFYNLGSSLESLGRKGEARLYFERVIAEFPDSEFAKRARERLANEKA
jgi:outer membrane protein assembly factor BamD